MTDTDTFETGPIRPPSEAGSYLLRLTRNCPWNRCAFCRTYKLRSFELREVQEIEADIDAMARIRDRLLARAGGGREVTVTSDPEWMVANALSQGGATAFLQDADSLVMKPDRVRRVLGHFRARFPEVIRITTYARSRTVARLAVEDLASYREQGLTRIHIGMETGHDPLLEIIHKGATAALHVKGGRNVVAAGLELSEYLIPGLGGRELSEGHARDSARVLTEIDPHFIRLRSLTLGPKIPLWQVFHGEEAQLTRQTDVEVVAEIRRFVDALGAVRSRLVSDHIMNLLGDLEGQLPGERDHLLATCDRFLALEPTEQRLYQLARRAGLVNGVGDLARPGIRQRAEQLLADALRRHGPDGVDEACREMMLRMV
jgi:hypothetical protein